MAPLHRSSSRPCSPRTSSPLCPAFPKMITRPTHLGEPRIYSGVSDRPRGWKSRKLGENIVPPESKVKRWDGNARTCEPWDSLRRDPELWFNDGNCLVHLYAKGKSRRGPAFKLPLADLLAARSHPLVKRCYVSEHLTGCHGESEALAELWSLAERGGPIELYIPAPAIPDSPEALLYHLSTRNYFAWVFRKPLVGDHLGRALINLMHSMADFRSPGVDNVGDLVSYLDQEGYLDMEDHPDHALSVLHLAETFELEELYINAFAHCAGMSEQLYLSAEYQRISSISRKLIRKGRADMDARLAQAGRMLRTFVEDDLSEAYLNLSIGERTHLDRFRSFLFTFYATQFGYFPPPCIDAGRTIYEPAVYRIMLSDFRCLYEYLVDERCKISGSNPTTAESGIPTLQSVQNFDARHQYDSLSHPLPLLPQVTVSAAALPRLSWLGRGEKRRAADLWPLSHTALMEATNVSRLFPVNNKLVLEYKKFEEDLLYGSHKADKAERVSLVDARKVRWILVYAVYQTLRSCAKVPEEVREPDAAPYHLSVSTANLPPWAADRSVMTLLRSQADVLSARPSSSSSSGWTSSVESADGQVIAIKPARDYFAEAHPDASNGGDELPESTNGHLHIKSAKRRSVMRSLRRTASFRRSLIAFRKQGDDSASVMSTEMPPHREILVPGYGNGINDQSPEPSTPSAQSGEKDSSKRISILSTTSTVPSIVSSSTKTTESSAANSITDFSGEPGLTESPRTVYSSTTWAASRESLVLPKEATEASAALQDIVQAGGVGPADTLLPSLGPEKEEQAPPLPRKSSARLSRLLFPRERDDDKAARATVEAVKHALPPAQAPPPLPLMAKRRFTAPRPTVAFVPNDPDAWHDMFSLEEEGEDEEEGERLLWEKFADPPGFTPIAVA